MKKLLVTLTLISASTAAIELPPLQSRLEEIMREHFSRGTTDQDLIEARDERGYTILEVLQEKAAQASDPWELVELCYTLGEITPHTQQQIQHAIQQEQRDVNVSIKPLLEKYEADKQKMQTIMGNAALFEIVKNNILLEEQKTRLLQENNRLMLSKLELSQKNKKLQHKIDYESDSIFQNRAFLPIVGTTVVITAAVTLGINSLMKK